MQADSNCTEGNVRLIDENGRVAENTGRVEICINRAWGSICRTLFDANDARVVCSQLGFPRLAGRIIITRYDCMAYGMLQTIQCCFSFNQNSSSTNRQFDEEC